MAEKSEKKLTHSIPTHLSLPRQVLGPFTRMQLLLVFAGALFSANLYISFAFLERYGIWGFWVHLFVACIPLLLSLLLALIHLAGRSLATWCVLALRHWYKPREIVWRSVCQQDIFASPAESIIEEEKSR